AIEDATGNVVTTDNSTVVTFSKSYETGTLLGLGSATASSGIATKTVTGVLSGSITLTAHSGSLTDGTTTFTVVAGTATQVVVTKIGRASCRERVWDIVVAIEEDEGNVVTNDHAVVVTFTKP